MSLNTLLKIAENEIGYLEKKTNSQLDSKTANAGSNNWTKYGQDLIKEIGSPYSNGVAWCDMFVDWCFLKAFGKEKAKSLLGGWSAYTPTSAQYFKNMGRWYTSNPKVGDQIFFKNTERICHTGIVYKVDSLKVYTIEGNTSGANGVIANGGGVCKKSYYLSYNKIAGYGRPNYDSVSDKINSITTSTNSNISLGNMAYTKKQFIKDVQTAVGAKVDGIAGSETLSKTVTVSKTKNNRHAVVKPIQKYLNVLGYNCGTVDGIAGVKFDSAIKAYQKANGCVADGEITAKKNTWKSLLGLR